MDGKEATVDTRVALVLASAVQAVSLADAAETYYLDSKPKFTDEELNAAAERIEILKGCHAVLTRMKEHLGSGVRPEVRQLLADLRTLLQLGQAAGIKVDPKINAALAALEGFIQ